MKPTHTFGMLVLGLTLTVLASVTAFAQPPVPHDVEENGVSFEDCVSCHRTGEDDAPLLAADHAQHDNGDCRVCHSTTGMAQAPATSHPVAGWEDCRGCHDRWDNRQAVEIPNLADSDYDHAIYRSDTCLSCHPAAADNYQGMPPVACGVCHPESVEAQTVHNGPENWVDCVDCHQAAANYPHDAELIRSRDEDCIACHHERDGHWTSDKADVGYSLSDHVARGDPHARVDCSACHLKVATVERDPVTNQIQISLPETEEGVPPDDPALADVVKEVDCQRCHASESAIAAPARELPPRSVLCMTCHDASPVVRDSVSWAGIGIFGLGMVMIASVWLQGSVGGRQDLSLPARIWGIVLGVLDLITTPRVFVFLWSFLVDGILHRQLFRKDKVRWLTHTFMFWGLGARMALGIFTWLMGWAAPIAPLTQILVNKSHPAVALVYEGLGVLVIVGALMATVRRYVVKDDQLITGGQDTVAIALIGAIFLMGFVVEGARILTTDLRPGLAVFSSIGYVVSQGLGLIPLDWSVAYGWLWFVHAGLVAGLVAYLPFSKFIHVLIGPFVAAYGATQAHTRRSEARTS
jgi:nitrate reductase gamma subunit